MTARVRIAAAAVAVAIAAFAIFGSAGGAAGPRPIERVNVPNGSLSLPAAIGPAKPRPLGGGSGGDEHTSD